MYKLSLRNQIIFKIQQLRKLRGYEDNIIYNHTNLTDIKEILVYMILENERRRHGINKVGDGGAGVGYDTIGDDIID